VAEIITFPLPVRPTEQESQKELFEINDRSWDHTNAYPFASLNMERKIMEHLRASLSIMQQKVDGKFRARK